MSVYIGGDIVGRIEIEEVKLELTQKEFLFRISYEVLKDLRYVFVFFNLSYYGALIAFGPKNEDLKRGFRELINKINILIEKAEKFVRKQKKLSDKELKEAAKDLKRKLEDVLEEVTTISKMLVERCKNPGEKVRNITKDIKEPNDKDDHSFSLLAKDLGSIEEVRLQVTTIAAFKCFRLCMNKLSEQLNSLADFEEKKFEILPFLKLENLSWTVLVNVNITAIEVLCSCFCNIEEVKDEKGLKCQLYCLIDRFLKYLQNPPNISPNFNPPHTKIPDASIKDKASHPSDESHPDESHPDESYSTLTISVGESYNETTASFAI